MATTRVDWLNDGTIPQTKSSGNWTPADFNAGKIRFTLTFAAASTGSPWRPTSPTYWAVLTTNESNGSALWIEYLPSTGVHTLIFVASDGAAILGSRALTWTASDDVTITIDQSSATAGASTMTIAGAATGDGTTAGWTRASVFSGSELRFGGWAASSTFNLPSGSVTTSDIDDGNDAVTGTLTATIPAVTSSATGALALAGSLTATIPAVTSSATGAVAIAGAMSATIDPVTASASGTIGGGTGSGSLTATIEPVTSAATGALMIAGAATPTIAAVTSTAAGAVAVTGALAATIGPVTLTASDAAPLALEDTAANRVLYGSAAGTCSITLTTGAATSILIVTGGRLADLATAPTDSEGNTYTAHGSAEEFADWPGYGLRGWICLAATGDAALVVSQQYGQTAGFDEVTIVGWAVSGATYAVTPAIVERAEGTTAQAPAISTSAPAIAVQAWCGDATTGATSVVSISSGTVNDVTTLVDHPNGYVPIAIATEVLSAPVASHAPTWSHTPTQGAILWSAALQAVEGRLGALSATVGPVTSSAAGELTSAGNLAATIAPVTASAAGALALSGAAAATVGPVTVAAAGTAANDGELAATIGPVTVAGVGALALTGQTAATIPAVTSTATGALPLAGALSATLGEVTVSAAGDLEGGAVGALAVTVGPVTAAATGSLALAGQSTPTIAPVTASAAGTVAIAGALSATVGAVTSTATGGGPRVALPRTFTVAIRVPAAADFTVEVDP